MEKKKDTKLSKTNKFFQQSMKKDFSALSFGRKAKKKRLDEFGKVIDEEDFHEKRSFSVNSKKFS